MFELKLALALNRSLGELYASVDSDELTLWTAYHLLYGLPHDRHEASIAISGAAFCQTMGGKVRPQDLIPVFHRPPADQKRGVQLFRDWVDAHNATQNDGRHA